MHRLLTIGLVGLGMMGRNHLRVCGSLAGVQLSGAYDPFDEALVPLEPNLVCQSIEELADRVDAAVVAVPTTEHVDVGLALVEAGVHVLIEKPLADVATNALKLLGAAESAGTVLAVGHIERFNPAVRELKARLSRGELGEVFQISTSRQGPFPARIKDVGVVKDLATHDIDLAQFIAGAAYESVSARVAHRAGRPHEDLVSAVATLEGGIVVNHMVNWLSPTKERQVTVTGERGRFVADTLTADLWFYENASVPSEWEQMSRFRGVSEGNMIRYAIPKPEPLRVELEQFCAACVDRSGEIVTGEEGLEVLRVAEAMLRSAERGTVEGIERS